MKLEDLNKPRDLLSEEDLLIYESTPYPFNLPIIAGALRTKLEEDPDYEMFVPMVYYKSQVYEKEKKNSPVIKPYKIYVSNKGVIFDGKRNVVIPTRCYGENAYEVFSVVCHKKPVLFTVHRAVACSFVEITDDCGPAHPRDLIINHLNGVKNSNPSTNLEWTTPTGNNVHAITTGLRSGVAGWKNNRSKPVKGTVLIGKHSGHEFILCGAKESEENGFFMAGISLCCLGTWEKYKNCSWAWASEEEIEKLPKGLDPDIKKTISFIVGRVKSKIKATHSKTGETFVIHRGYPEILELGFSPNSVSEVINGRKKTHKKYVFERVA